MEEKTPYITGPFGVKSIFWNPAWYQCTWPENQTFLFSFHSTLLDSSETEQPCCLSSEKTCEGIKLRISRFRVSFSGGIFFTWQNKSLLSLGRINLCTKTIQRGAHVRPRRTGGCKRVQSGGRVKAVTFQSRRFWSSTLDVVTAVGRIDVSAFCAAGNAASRTWTPHLSNPETSEIESFPLKRGQALEFH